MVTRAEAAALATAARTRGDHVAEVVVADAARTFDAFARAFAFPPYFGRNWDALADCLTDLTWLPAPRYLLVLEVQPEAPVAVVDLVLEICRDAAASWPVVGVPFDVVIVDDHCTTMRAR